MVIETAGAGDTDTLDQSKVSEAPATDELLERLSKMRENSKMRTRPTTLENLYEDTKRYVNEPEDLQIFILEALRLKKLGMLPPKIAKRYDDEDIQKIMRRILTLDPDIAEDKEMLIRGFNHFRKRNFGVNDQAA